jgi:tetratricopeptide (TPR) repeat protein
MASERAVALAPQSSEARFWMIKSAEKRAVWALWRFEQLEPGSEKTHLLLGDIYRQRQRLADAEAEYKQALSISAHDIAPLYGLASCYFADSKVDQALVTAKQGIEESPNDPDLNLLIGEILISRHDWANAEPFLQLSLTVKPQILPHVHALLGEVYQETNRFQEAIGQFKLSLSLQPDQDGSIHYRLARIYQKLGDTSSASAEINQFKAISQSRRERAVVALEDSISPHDVQD